MTTPSAKSRFANLLHRHPMARIAMLGFTFAAIGVAITVFFAFIMWWMAFSETASSRSGTSGINWTSMRSSLDARNVAYRRDLNGRWVVSPPTPEDLQRALAARPPMAPVSTRSAMTTSPTTDPSDNTAATPAWDGSPLTTSAWPVGVPKTDPGLWAVYDVGVWWKIGWWEAKSSVRPDDGGGLGILMQSYDSPIASYSMNAADFGWPFHSFRHIRACAASTPLRSGQVLYLHRTPLGWSTTPTSIPWIPIWSGLLRDSALFAAIVATIWALYTGFAPGPRGRRRIARGECRKCRYSRIGLADGTPCPECGTPCHAVRTGA